MKIQVKYVNILSFLDIVKYQTIIMPILMKDKNYH